MTDSTIAGKPWALWKIVIVTAIASAIGNLVLMMLTISSLAVPDSFAPLTPAPIVLWSFIGAFGAIGAYALIRRRSDSPQKVFAVVSVLVLILSFLPDVVLVNVAEGPFGGATTGAIIVLMIMHVISFAIVVPMLRSLAK
jgi:uncharacterized membrane protein YozB (DUF420 family)